MQTHNTGFSPYALYKTPPSTGPIKDANELIVLINLQSSHQKLLQYCMPTAWKDYSDSVIFPPHYAYTIFSEPEAAPGTFHLLLPVRYKSPSELVSPDP